MSFVFFKKPEIVRVLETFLCICYQPYTLIHMVHASLVVQLIENLPDQSLYLVTQSYGNEEIRISIPSAYCHCISIILDHISRSACERRRSCVLVRWQYMRRLCIGGKDVLNELLFLEVSIGMHYNISIGVWERHVTHNKSCNFVSLWRFAGLT